VKGEVGLRLSTENRLWVLSQKIGGPRPVIFADRDTS